MDYKRVVTAVANVEVGFGGTLRRWRVSRRLSQQDLALRAGTTQRHLSFIESGRSHPGRGLVVRLGESLELSLRDRNGLLAVAGYAPVYPESPLEEQTLRPVRDALASIVAGHRPYPAMVLRRHGQLLVANDAIDVLLEGALDELLRPPVNVLRVMLHPHGLGGRIENLAEWGRHVVENLRAKALRHPDPQLDDLITELADYVPAAPPGDRHLGFAVPMRLRTEDGNLRLITTLTSFATAVDITVAELNLEAFLPADERSAEILRGRAERRSGAPLRWFR